jgi:hypothetical protein
MEDNFTLISSYNFKIENRIGLKLVNLVLIVCILFIFSPAVSLGQSVHHEDATEEGGHKFTVALGHAHVKEGIENGKNKWLVMGAWAINYDYLLNSKWSMGLHNDIIIEDFTVERHLGEEEETEIEREIPIATKLVGSFNPGRHTSYIVGVGEEFAKGEHLFLSTVGVEYGVHLAKGWELGAELSYDIKWNAYDTWILGVGVSKTIPLHHKKI